ncbi:unnamed protein product [Caenorhabditis bovis]|uniref:CCHC-type domain-containing protein n=1 Tax=Caenorhabditis bovis TaxID=2654633 RepID=A0A8S1E6M5_9PELO|nr:unnamed protein product [Caenorhabditis bovis]
MNDDVDVTRAANELEQLGFRISGSTKLKQFLSKSRKVNTFCGAIGKFELENRIQMKHLRPALELLDNQKISRFEFYEASIQKLCEKIIERIEQLSESDKEEDRRKLETLLERYFYTYRIPYFRPIVVKLLETVPELQEKYVNIVCADPSLYNSCGLQVKRAAWKHNQHLFLDSIQPIIDSYIKMEIIMAAHDLNMERITNYDHLHGFAWALDTLIRDKKLDTSHLQKLKSLLDAMMSNEEVEIGSNLPRESVPIQVIVQLLVVSAQLYKISDSWLVPSDEDNQTIKFITEFLPSFSAMLCEDTIRNELYKRNTEPCDSPDITIANYSKNPPDEVIQWLENSELACILWLHHCLSILPKEPDFMDFPGLLRYFSQLPTVFKTVRNSFMKLQVKDEDIKYLVLRLINQLGFIWGVPICLQMMDIIQPINGKVVLGSHCDVERYSDDFLRVVEKLQPKNVSVPMSNSNFEPMPFRRKFGNEAASSSSRTLADLEPAPPPIYDPNAFVDASGSAIVRPVVTGACKKCGYPGHLAYQCRNYIQLKPNVSTVAYELSSTSSDESDEEETPLVKDTKKKRKKEKKEKKNKKHKKKTKKRRAKDSSDSDSDEEERKKKKKKKKRKRRHGSFSTSISDSDLEEERKTKKRSRRTRQNSSSSDESEAYADSGKSDKRKHHKRKRSPSC